MTTHALDRAAYAPPTPTTFRGRIRVAALTIGAGYDRWLQRRALEDLDDDLLKDLGITRSDADSESAKPFWR